MICESGQMGLPLAQMQDKNGPASKWVRWSSGSPDVCLGTGCRYLAEIPVWSNLQQKILRRIVVRRINKTVCTYVTSFHCDVDFKLTGGQVAAVERDAKCLGSVIWKQVISFSTSTYIGLLPSKHVDRHSIPQAVRPNWQEFTCLSDLYQLWLDGFNYTRVSHV